MKKIVFTGGGTLGHVMPNLYLIEELKDNYDISYIGSNGVEKEQVKNIANFYEIPTTKLVRGKILVNFKIPFVLIKSILRAKKVLKEIKPDLIFSKGGYVALPVCLAGRMLKIPIIAHESDASFGLANKIILKLCSTMCVNFKNLENSKNKKIIHTGPILSENFNSTTTKKGSFNLDSNKKTLLIIGGSLGSQKINLLIYPILKDLLKFVNIIHITGTGNLKIKSFDNYNSLEKTNDIVNIYNLSNFVLSRSGAGVSAECCFKELPMLLIPLENKASRGDQVLNAKYYKKLGVAEILHQADLTPTLLLKELKSFYNNLDKYAKSYSNLKQKNGKEKVLKLIKEKLN